MEQEPQNLGTVFNRLASAVEALVRQERWTRRFANVLKLSVVAYIVFFIYLATQKMSLSDDIDAFTDGAKHAAIVRLDGPIMPGTKISAEEFNPLLAKAFSNLNSAAVIIKVNSPGGSPVQSALINDEIVRLKKLHDKPVYVVVEDICASGCYYIAVAADKIYANKGSMIGSIGVRMDSFGVTHLMEKLGIENRSMRSGEHKAFIDPFSPIDETGRKFFQKKVLDKVHQQFIAAVQKGRGNRIIETNETYTGLIWLGDDAVKNGLIDGLSDVHSVARDIIGVKKVRVYESKKSLIEEVMSDFSTSVASKLAIYLSTMH